MCKLCEFALNSHCKYSISLRTYDQGADLVNCNKLFLNTVSYEEEDVKSNFWEVYRLTTFKHCLDPQICVYSYFKHSHGNQRPQNQAFAPSIYDMHTASLPEC
jgi:hypothetical protein